MTPWFTNQAGIGHPEKISVILSVAKDLVCASASARFFATLRMTNCMN